MSGAAEGAVQLAFRHQRGANCTTTSMMNLLHFHGLDLSEELCLGIGGGLGFTYLRGRSLPLYLVFGRSDDLEFNLARAVGAHLELNSDSDPRVAWRGVLDELRGTGPVLLDTDVSRMPYTAEMLAWLAELFRAWVTESGPIMGTCNYWYRATLFG